MCWSFEVSIITGTISYSIATYLWIRNSNNDRWHAIVLFTISTIQFLEAIVWHMNKNGLDKSNITKVVITILIPLILALEPVSALYGASYVGNKVSDLDKLFYLGVFVIIFIVLMTDTSYPNVISDSTIHYQKKDTEHKIYYWIFFLLIIYPFIRYVTLDKFYILIGSIIAIALIMSLDKKSPGSTWCLYGNVIAIIFLFYPYIKNIN